jgi:hypothetical protein
VCEQTDLIIEETGNLKYEHTLSVTWPCPYGEKGNSRSSDKRGNMNTHEIAGKSTVDHVRTVKGTSQNFARGRQDIYRVPWTR